MNGLGKQFRKKSDPKNWKKKTVEIKVKLPHVNKKTTSKKSNFCSNTGFSLYFKFKQKKFTPQNHSLFRSTSCFGVIKNHENVWTDRKKRQHLNTIQILWIVKKPLCPNNSRYRFAAINKINWQLIFARKNFYKNNCIQQQISILILKL